MNNSKKITLISDIINNLDLNKKRVLIDFLSQLNVYTISLRIKDFSLSNNTMEPIDNIFSKVYEKILNKNTSIKNNNNKTIGSVFNEMLYINLSPSYLLFKTPSEEDKKILVKIKQHEEIKHKKRLEKNSDIINNLENAFSDKYDMDLLGAFINCIILDVEFYNKKVKDYGLRNNSKIKEFKEIINLSPKLLKCYNSRNNIEHLKFLEDYSLQSKTS